MPMDSLAEVYLNIAPTSLARFLALSSGIISWSNKSDLFPAIPITIYIKY